MPEPAPWPDETSPISERTAHFPFTTTSIPATCGEISPDHPHADEPHRPIDLAAVVDALGFIGCSSPSRRDRMMDDRIVTDLLRLGNIEPTRAFAITTVSTPIVEGSNVSVPLNVYALRVLRRLGVHIISRDVIGNTDECNYNHILNGVTNLIESHNLTPLRALVLFYNATGYNPNTIFRGTLTSGHGIIADILEANSDIIRFLDDGLSIDDLMGRGSPLLHKKKDNTPKDRIIPLLQVGDILPDIFADANILGTHSDVYNRTVPNIQLHTAGHETTVQCIIRARKTTYYGLKQPSIGKAILYVKVKDLDEHLKKLS
jgi:hypothetical protein